jgi:simple sugar transport system ATP-binding protein
MLGPTRVVDAATGATVGASRIASAGAGSPPDIEDAPEPLAHRHHSAASRTAIPRSAPHDGRIVIRAEGLAAADARGIRTLRHATLQVAAGEILGVVGIEGAGHRELLRVLAGRQAPLDGHLELPPQVGFVPEDRHRDALILDFSLVENIALHGAGARRGLLPWREIEARTSALVAAYDVRAPGSRIAARALSGGNQQKLVLARELERAPAALIAENPTRGLDIQATAAVHARLRAARARGVAVVVYSSDLDEVLGIADRVLVAYDGRVREVGGGREAVGRAMLGVG